ncbi:MAG: hypothetical protein FRX49_04130 [Trebouxia sp. A1-2]|nr:MAG: hypothetical protein FRX49_04130 [Trebouxia sp. A1-2]
MALILCKEPGRLILLRTAKGWSMGLVYRQRKQQAPTLAKHLRINARDPLKHKPLALTNEESVHSMCR